MQNKQKALILATLASFCSTVGSLYWLISIVTQCHAEETASQQEAYGYPCAPNSSGRIHSIEAVISFSASMVATGVFSVLSCCRKRNDDQVTDENRPLAGAVCAEPINNI